MYADGGVERAWQLAATTERGMVDLLAAAPGLSVRAFQDELFPRIRDQARTMLERMPSGSPEGTYGRYVRLEQQGCCETQSLAEVEVLDAGVNLAIGGRAEQKSTVSGGEARRAIDGNTAGSFRLGSVSQSVANEADPWWEVDLGEERPISEIRVWKRDEGEISGGIDGFTVRVLDARRQPTFVQENVDAQLQPVPVGVGAGRDAPIRRAAERALIALPGNEAERLAIFEELLRRGVDRDLAVLGIDTVLAAGGSAGDAASLAAELLRFAEDIPSADRTGPTFARAAELGGSLAAALPAAEATGITTGFALLVPKLVQIRAVEGAMTFDLEDFDVEAGREVEIVFRNPDVMPHNLVVTTPGAGERVGRAADAMAAQPDAFAKNFVPDIPEVLFATRLISPGERVTLSFRAPDQPGEYPFICSFPGHWITMKGIMRVGR
jgi:azurin